MSIKFRLLLWQSELKTEPEPIQKFGSKQRKVKKNQTLLHKYN